MGKNIKMGDGPARKRGRPAGKNRIPLSKAERLERSARYEKERREEIADAIADLADAIGCNRDIRNCDLLATVVSFIESRTHTSSEVDSLRKENQELEKQIRCMERQLTKKSVKVTPQRPLPSASNVEVAAFACESPLISSTEQHLAMESEEVSSQLMMPPTLLTPPLLPEDIFELDFAAALPLGSEGVGMHNPHVQPSSQAGRHAEVQAQTTAGDSESILPPDILDFILEYTSRRHVPE